MKEHIYSNSDPDLNSDFEDKDYEDLISRLKKIKENIALLDNQLSLNK